MKTILITGGAGFIGSHLVESLLKKNFKIICIDNFNDYYEPEIKVKNLKEVLDISDKDIISPVELAEYLHSNPKNNFILYYEDIRNTDNINNIFSKHKIDLVFHLAAMAGVRPSIQDPVLYEEVNNKGTLNILEAMRKNKVKKGIFASSSSVYGNNKSVPFKETDNVDRAISPYAATKKANEVMAHTYHHLYDLNIMMMRFFTVYGPRQRPDLAIHKFTKLITENKELPFYGDGTTRRDYTYIDDIIQGLFNALSYIDQNENVYEIINLGESQTISLMEMVKTIEAELETKAKLKMLPLQPGDVKQTYADISKAKKIINYNPSTEFKEGIKRFVQWYKSV